MKKEPSIDISITPAQCRKRRILPKHGIIAIAASAVWGYARAADSLGVDILQNCEVTGVKRSQDNIESLET